MEDQPDSCSDFEFMECYERKKKRERLMREKSLKRPFLEDEEEARKMNRRNGTLVIRERNEEDRVPEKCKEDERLVEEEPEKLSIEEEEEPRRPRKSTLEDLIEVLFDDLEIQWNLRMEQNGVGWKKKEPQSLNKILVSGISDDEEEEPLTLNEGDILADLKEVSISNSGTKPSMRIVEEKPRRSNRRRRRLEIEISDDEGFKQMSEEEFKLSDEDKKPKKKMKKVNNNNNNNKNNKKQKAVAPRVEVVEGDDPPPDLPEDFKARIREMNGTDLILVLQKRLFKTDIEKGENWLSIPLNQIEREFLTEEEKVRVVEGMQVMLIQPSLEESTMTFKKWKMKESCHLSLYKPMEVGCAGKLT